MFEVKEILPRKVRHQLDGLLILQWSSNWLQMSSVWFLSTQLSQRVQPQLKGSTSIPPPEPAQTLTPAVGTISSANENSDNVISSKVWPASNEPANERNTTPATTTEARSIYTRRPTRVRAPPDRYGFMKTSAKKRSVVTCVITFCDLWYCG